ncbi:hypothetical protein [Chryseobacterium schmidteae]|uniref:hypothetical protein n=1 Tax=Chryseobacterium schmidteae TaxID=2730404 RepID=UPI00158A4157|nr:hypothetical protein [Chryseobacterium schmidteae]
MFGKFEKKMKVYYIAVLYIFFSSCSKSDLKNSKINIDLQKENNSIELENQTEQDSIMYIREKKNTNSILYINQGKEFYNSTLNLTLNEIYNILKSDISSLEDLLSSKNWKMYERGIIEKIEAHKKGVSIDEIINSIRSPGGKFIRYRNMSSDSEIYAFQNDDTHEITFSIHTINDFNYNNILKDISKLSFNSVEGNSTHDPEIDLSGEKKYIGEYVNIESKIKFYLKEDFEIKTYYYIKSPVINSFKSKDKIGAGYSYSYDNSKRKSYYTMIFLLKEH